MAFKNPPSRSECLKLALEVFEMMIKPERSDIISAYSEGSLSRGDMMPGSDIDITVVVSNPREPPPTPGRIKRLVNEEHELVIEWAYIKESEYNIKEILSDAGFTHDLLNAHIHYDPQGFIKSLKDEIIKKYDSKKLIKLRAKNQLKDMKNDYLNLIKALKRGDEKKTLSNAVEFIKHSLGLPRAVLNKHLTNSRALLYCMEACTELRAPRYMNLLLDFIGVDKININDAKLILSNAKEIIKSHVNDEVLAETYLKHLVTSEYLISEGMPAEAVWPLLMWTNWVYYNEGEITLRTRVLWNKILKILKWTDYQDVIDNLSVAHTMIKDAKVVINKIN